MKKTTFLFLLVSFVSVCTVSCGEVSFNVAQAKNTIELGDSIDVTQLLDYNSEEISEITVLNADELNTDKVGNYNLRFQVQNSKGKTQEKTFDFSVVDTQPPLLNVNTNDIYIALGTEFDISEYVTISDKSNTEKLEMDGTVDLNTEGVYNLEVYGVDESGNQSEKEALKVTVEDRRDCDFRNAKFGDNKETVKRYELLDCIQEEDNSLAYFTDLSGEEAFLFYSFNNNDELYTAGYIISEAHTNYNIYLSKYNEIKENIIQKYGSPETDKKNKGSLYNYCSDEAQALQLGEVSYYTMWNLERYKIELGLSEDNNDIIFLLRYFSKDITQDKDLSDY